MFTHEMRGIFTKKNAQKRDDDASKHRSSTLGFCDDHLAFAREGDAVFLQLGHRGGAFLDYYYY